VTYQQVGQQDGHENDEHYPQDIGHGREGDFPMPVDLLDANATGCLAEDVIEYKLSCCHGDCLEDGATRCGEGSRLKTNTKQEGGEKESEQEGEWSSSSQTSILLHPPHRAHRQEVLKAFVHLNSAHTQLVDNYKEPHTLIAGS